MANARTYRVDPNVFLPTNESGAAQSPVNPSAAVWPKILAAVNQQSGGYELLDTTAASLDLTVYESRLSVSGTMAFTLPNGTFIGQKKRVRCIAAASTPACTLTVTTPETATGFACASTFFFDTLGQEIEFEWTENSKWRAIYVKRAGGTADNVVVGTTVLTGKNLWQLYALSVTGTVVSATTKGIPNGSAPGERIVIGNSTAATTPVGSIAITARSIVGGAVADLQAIGATADTAVCEWDGQKWQILTSTGITLA